MVRLKISCFKTLKIQANKLETLNVSAGLIARQWNPKCPFCSTKHIKKPRLIIRDMQHSQNPIEKDDFAIDYFNLYPIKDEGTGFEYDIYSNPIKSGELLAKVISDRVSFLRMNIEGINRQIQERQQLKDSLDAGIDDKLCQTRTLLHQMDSFRNIANISSRRISLENMVADLYKEKRYHQLSHWRDTVMLEKELRKIEKELLSALRDLWLVRFIS